MKLHYRRVIVKLADTGLDHGVEVGGPTDLALFGISRAGSSSAHRAPG
ncbi:MAG: hypothetical protein L0Z50_41555 [Verrucomicrobiales bacterium]|nr:hypothetical protein [Verrucomicrobiales bacterium]